MGAFYNEIPPEIQSSNWTHKDNDPIPGTTIHDIIPQDFLDRAVAIAQSVESKAFNMVQLSVQELVDCDTKYNEGCIGGNPVMSFPYIHKYGLVSSLDYAYDGMQHNKCKKERLGKPIVTSDSWGLLKEEDEAGMKFALRHLGPLSVGFNGGDKAFLTYSGGIFDSKKCSNHPNHAILITGYGENVKKNGEVVSVIKLLLTCYALHESIFSYMICVRFESI